MDFPLLVRDPEKQVRSLVRKITHSGETELDKQHLTELKEILKASKQDLVVSVFEECMKCLRKEHSQVRVSTVKLSDYLFQKSHVFREKILDQFDIFLELTLAITQRPKVKLKLPPPKKFAALLQELTAKLINSWHSDYGLGYDKIRYAYKFLREHRLVDFSQFQVRTHEDLIRQQKLAERQEKILTRSIENRLREFRELKPEIEQLLAQVESLLDLLVPASNDLLQAAATTSESVSSSSLDDEVLDQRQQQQQYGIVSLSQRIDIEFSPYVEVQRNHDNKEIVQNLKELKKELAEGKLIKLVAIEKTLSKRSDQLVNTLREIIDLKTRSTNLILKLGELKITDDPVEGGSCGKKTSKPLDNVGSESDDDESEFEDVEPKEGLETYIPKSMRFEYGLEPIDPMELSSSSRVTLTDESFGTPSTASCSSSSSLAIACNVRLESGKLCPRRDRVKCPFHGKIIPRDHNGMPLDEADRLAEERKSTSNKDDVPDWQDPELLRDIQAATGVDLKMPKKGKSSAKPNKKLANTKVCDLTPKKRLQRKLKLLNR